MVLKVNKIFYRPNLISNIALWSYGWNATLSDNFETNFNGKSNGVGYGGRMTFKFTELTRLEFSLSGRTDMKITTGTIPANYRSDIGIQKSFLKNKLSITFKISDIFDTEKFIIKTQTSITNSETREKYQQKLHAERRADKRFVAILINYNFGKKQKKRFKERQKQIELSRKKNQSHIGQVKT